MAEKRILLIVGGGIAAYKSLELVRLARKAGLAVRPILTQAGAEFVTPLSLSALAEDKVYADLFSLTDEDRRDGGKAHGSKAHDASNRCSSVAGTE